MHDAHATYRCAFLSARNHAARGLSGAGGVSSLHFSRSGSLFWWQPMCAQFTCCVILRQVCRLNFDRDAHFGVKSRLRGPSARNTQFRGPAGARGDAGSAGKSPTATTRRAGLPVCSSDRRFPRTLYTRALAGPQLVPHTATQLCANSRDGRRHGGATL